MAARMAPVLVDKIPLEVTSSAEERDPSLHWLGHSTTIQKAVKDFMDDLTDAAVALRLILDPHLKNRDLQKFEQDWDTVMSFHPKLPPQRARVWCAEMLIYGSVDVPEAVAALRDIQLVINSGRAP